MESCLPQIKNSDYEVVSYSLQPNQSTDLPAKQPTQAFQLSSYPVSNIIELTTDTQLKENNFHLKKQKARVNLIQKFKQADNKQHFQCTQISKQISSLVPINDTNSFYKSILEVSSTIKSNDLSESQIYFEEEDKVYAAFSNETYYSPVVHRSLSKASNSTDHVSLDNQ